MATAMAVTTITNRGTSTATWIRHSPKISVGNASSARRARADRLGPPGRVTRGRREHHVTRISRAQRDRPVRPACQKIKRHVRVNRTQSSCPISKTAACRTLMHQRPDQRARRAFHVKRVRRAPYGHRASRGQKARPVQHPRKSPTGWMQTAAHLVTPSRQRAPRAPPL